MLRNVCNCIYHSNANLILETLHSNIRNIFPLHSDQLVKDCVCEIKNKTCMSSNCDLCKEKFNHKFLDVVPTEKLKLLVKWLNWENNENDQLGKKMKSGSLEDLLKKVKSVLGQFIFHWYVKNEQFEAYNKMKQLATEENSNTTVIQMDFAENFMFVPG